MRKQKQSGDAAARVEPTTEWKVLDGNMIYRGDKFVAITTNPRCAQDICVEANASTPLAPGQQHEQTNMAIWHYDKSIHFGNVFCGQDRLLSVENPDVATEAEMKNLITAHNASLSAAATGEDLESETPPAQNQIARGD